MTAAPILSKVWSLYHMLRKDGAFSVSLYLRIAPMNRPAVLERIRVERESESPDRERNNKDNKRRAA